MLFGSSIVLGIAALIAIGAFRDSLLTAVEEQAKSLQMKLPFVEEARESLGLVICLLVNRASVWGRTSMMMQKPA